MTRFLWNTLQEWIVLSLRINALFRNRTILRNSILSLCIIVYSHNGYAQVDSTYIAPFSQEFSVGVYSYYRYTVLTHEEAGGYRETYLPNSPVGIGLSISYKGYSLSGGYGLRFLRDKELGKTESMDWQYHYYGRRFVVDGFFQRYKGFYTEENNGPPYTLYPDLSMKQYGLNGLYVFNNKKFSYRAAFSQSEQQLKSAGSFQLGAGVFYNQVASDSSFSIDGRNKLDNYQLNLNLGYIYTKLIKKRYYVSLGASLAINLSTEDLSPIKKVEVLPSVFPRFAAGYNADTWSLGMTFLMTNMYMYKNEPSELFFGTGSMRFKYIKRFNLAPRFLKKVKVLN